MKTIKKILAVIIGAAFSVFAVTQVIYWRNLDNKAIFLLYKLLHKHYDTIERDRRF